MTVAKGTRRVSTRQDKIDALNYIKVMCDKKAQIRDGFLMKRFGVWYVIRRLVNNGVLIPLGKKDGSGVYSESKTYTFHSNKLTMDEIVDLVWQMHGHSDGSNKVKKPTQQPIKFADGFADELSPVVKFVDEKIEYAPAKALPKNFGETNGAVAYYGGTLAENIEEWLRMCEQFDIRARGEFIFAQLKINNALK